MHDPARNVGTRAAMLRNGSPVAIALSIACLSGLEQAKQVLGIPSSHYLYPSESLLLINNRKVVWR